MKPLVRNVSMLSVLVLSAACSSGGNDNPVDLGEREVTVRGQKLSDYAGNWDGYGEATTFDGNGSDRLRVTLASDGTGTVRFGDMDPPTIPAAADLLTVPYIEGNRVGKFGAGASGFDYTVHDTTLTGKRLRFAIDSREVFDDYCPLFTPMPDTVSPGGSGYNCADPSTPPNEQCNSVCSCDATSCVAQRSEGIYLHAEEYIFDGTLEGTGDEFVATLASKFDPSQQRTTVRLTRPSD